MSERPRLGLRPTELLVVVLFWAFLATLTAIGRLLDPRVPDFLPEVRNAVISLAFIEYTIWAALTLPIAWLVNRLSAGTQTRAMRIAVLFVVGLAVGLGMSLVVNAFREHLFPPPRGRSARAGATVPLSLVGDLLVYGAIVSAALARNYFLRYQARLDETRLLQAESAKLAGQLAEAKLTVLRSQLNPHFLFNTLHAVSSLVERDPRGVRKMIARLSDLLRFTLEQSGEAEITLDRELDLLRRYLDIMEVRFQNRLEIVLHVADAVRDALVPNLLLQPLVENALEHGVGAIDGTGRIEIDARRSGDALLLTVRDNGPGIAEPRKDGVGLRNTLERLNQLYDSRHRFALRAAEGGGTVAEVSIPYHVADS